MARVAVVTGGTRGIGAAISKALKGAGYNVAANYAGNDEAAEQFQKETGIAVFKWDVSNYEACAAGLAKVEASHGGDDEAVLLNTVGSVAEATGENIFVIKNGVLLTPPLSAGALEGVTRDSVMTIARDFGYEVREQNLLRTDLLRRVGGWRATEPFLIDQGTYLRILRYSDLVAIPETLAAFRISSTQWSVSLAADQAKQAAALHARVREEFPETVGWLDVRLGNVQALRTAWMRRAAYFVWRKRMRASG